MFYPLCNKKGILVPLWKTLLSGLSTWHPSNQDALLEDHVEFQKESLLQPQFKFNSQKFQPQSRRRCAHQEDAVIDKRHPLQDHQEIKYYLSIELAQESLCSLASRIRSQSTLKGKNIESAAERRLCILHRLPRQSKLKKSMRFTQSKSILLVLSLLIHQSNLGNSSTIV